MTWAVLIVVCGVGIAIAVGLIASRKRSQEAAARIDQMVDVSKLLAAPAGSELGCT